jgi:AAA family ATP:ADP antiporter
MGALVDLKPDERRNTLAAFFALLGITAAHTMMETSRDALFLARLPVSRLPLMYIAIAAVGLVLSRVGSGRKKESRRRVPVALGLSAAVTAGFWLLRGTQSQIFLYTLYLWTGLFASWVVGQFWLVLGVTYDVSQAKRLFGFIGAGSVLGAVAGAGLARALTVVISAQHLLLAGAGILVATALGPALMFEPGEAAPAKKGDAERAAVGSSSELAVVTRDPYVRRILLLVLLSTMTVTAVDFLFKRAVAEAYPKEQLASVFATIYVVLNATAFAAQLFAVPVIFRALGVHRALWIVPILLASGAVGVLAGGGLVAAILLRGVDGTFRHSLHKTSAELLFVPIPDAARARAKPLIDLIGQRGGQAIAAVGILGVVALWPGRGLSVAILALASAWLLVAASMKKPYLAFFRKLLQEGRSIDDRGELPELDLNALEALFAALNSRKDAEVIAALDLLAAQSRQRLIPALVLYHPSAPIVLRALDIFTREGRTDFVPIADRLLAHPDPEVRTAALRARSTVEPDEQFLRSLLEDPSDEIRATALVTLIARGWMTAAEADEALAGIAKGTAAVRLALARAIELDPSPKFVHVLLELIDGADVALATATARAMGSVRDEAFMPALLPLIGKAREGTAAREALAAIGDPALAFLDGAMKRKDLPREVRWATPRAIALFPPEKAAPVLMKHLRTATDGMVRYRIVQGLARARSRNPAIALDIQDLVASAEDTLRAALRNLSWRLDLERTVAEDPSRRTPALDLLLTLLRDKESDATARAFQLLGLIHPDENFGRIQRGLQSRNAKTRANSRELLENVTMPPLRAPILALCDDAPDAERLSRAASFDRPERLGYEELLRAMLERGDELRSLAAYHAAERRIASVRDSAGRVEIEDEGLEKDLIARAREMQEAADAR